MSAIRVDENPIQTCAVETTTAQDTCTKSSEQNQTLNIYALGDLLSFSSLEIKWYQPTPHPPVPQHKLLYPIQLARSHLS